MFWFGSASFWGTWLALGCLWTTTTTRMLQLVEGADNDNGKLPLVLRNQHTSQHAGRSPQSKEIRFDDDQNQDEENSGMDLNVSDSSRWFVGRAAASNGGSWKYSPQVVVTLDSTSNRRHQSGKGPVEFGQRKHRNPTSHHQPHQDDYYTYKLQHQPLTDSSLFSLTMSNTLKKKNSNNKEKCPDVGLEERSKEGARKFSMAEQAANEAATSWSGDDLSVQQLPKRMSVRLGNDVRVRSDLLLVRTPDTTKKDNDNNNPPIVRGLEVRNLSGSWFPDGDGFDHGTEPLFVELPTADDLARQKENFDYSPPAMDESHSFQSREDHDHPTIVTSGTDLNNTRGQLLVRASSSATQGIKVIQEPGALGLVMNQRGLIVAPKRSSYPSHSSSVYNASALFTNHINHSLSPVKVTPHAETTPSTPMLDVNRLASVGQRPPLVSTIRWRNTSKPALITPAGASQEMMSGQHSPNQANLWFNSMSRPHSSYYGTTLATTSVSPETEPPTTQRPAGSSSVPPQFLHNPPYKQNLVSSNLDLASSQQLVQEYDHKLASRTRPKQQSNKRPTGSDLNSSASTQQRPTNANRFPASMEIAANGSGSHHSVVKEQSGNGSGTYSHETLSTKPPFEINSTISAQLNTLANLNHNNEQSSSSSSSSVQIISAHPATSSHLMKPSLTGANGGKFMNKLQQLVIGKILKSQALAGGPSNSASSSSSSVTYGYHQSPSSSTPTSLVPQQQIVTPAPLLSTTVANNVASLIAQKLSSIFVKSVGPSLAASGYIVNPGVAGQSNNPNPLSGLSAGLGSLFGHRVPSLSNRPSNSIKHRFPNNIHSPIKRRTVGMGSLLASGLIYGISLLPALMALTGINPLTGSARTSSPASSQADVKSSSVINNSNNQQLTSASNNNIKKLPAPKNVYTPAAGSDQISPLQGTITYLVPVIPTLPSSLEAEEPPVAENDLPLDHLSYTASEPNDSIQPIDNTNQNYHQMSESAYMNNLDPLPIATNPANLVMHNSMSHQVASHPYSKYKGHLYYSRTFAPPSTSYWPERDSESSQPLADWATHRKRTIGRNQHPARREPIMSSNSHHHLHHTNSAKSGLNQPISHFDSSSNTFSTPASAPIRSYKVGYTLSYKPQEDSHHQQSSQQHSNFIEFQDVNDLVDEGSASQWRPLVAQRGFANNRAMFNLNQNIRDDSDKS